MRVTIDSDVKPGITATYLRVDGSECAFIEAHTPFAVPRMLAALAAAGKRPEDVRYVVVTHAHLDHASGASALMKACPQAVLLAHPRTAKHMIDPSKLVEGATQVYGAERFAALYGVLEPVPAARVRALADGETFSLGSATFRALHTAGHAWHHMVIDDPASGTVYTGDSFGLVYPALQQGALFALATTSPTGFHAAEAHKSIDRIVALGEPSVCLTHFGEQRDVAGIASQLHRWIDLSEQWRTEGGDIEAKMRAAIAADASARGAILDWDTLALDIELNTQGLRTAT